MKKQWWRIPATVFLRLDVAEVTACERNVRSPGTSQERAYGDVRVLVPLDRGLSASGSAHRLSLPSLLATYKTKK